MATQDDVRRFALSLPEAGEQDHNGFPSFRVGGKIFATLPDAEHVHVMLEADDIRAAARAHAPVCAEKWWGQTLAALRVELGAVAAQELEGWLGDAWWHLAPERLKPARD